MELFRELQGALPPAHFRQYFQDPVDIAVLDELTLRVPAAVDSLGVRPFLTGRAETTRYHSRRRPLEPGTATPSSNDAFYTRQNAQLGPDLSDPRYAEAYSNMPPPVYQRSPSPSAPEPAPPASALVQSSLFARSTDPMLSSVDLMDREQSPTPTTRPQPRPRSLRAPSLTPTAQYRSPFLQASPSTASPSQLARPRVPQAPLGPSTAALASTPPASSQVGTAPVAPVTPAAPTTFPNFSGPSPDGHAVGSAGWVAWVQSFNGGDAASTGKCLVTPHFFCFY